MALIKKSLILLIPFISLSISCRKKEVEEPPKLYESLTQWGVFGEKNENLNKPEKIAVGGNHLFISDDGNKKLKKFTFEGAFVKSIDYSDIFYIYGQNLYIYKNRFPYLIKYDFDFNIKDTIHLSESPGTAWFSSDIAGDDTEAFLFQNSSPHLTKLNFTDGSLTTMGASGKGALEFQSPGARIKLISDRYYLTDHRNDRVQVMDKAGNYKESFSTKRDGLEGGPNAMEVNKDHIFVGNRNNAGNNIHIYNTSNHSFVEELDVSKIFVTSMATHDDKLYVLAQHSDYTVYVFRKNSIL